MPLNKSKGNMYPWCDFTWNVIKGECPHQCSYCYCKRWGKQSPLHFDEKELKTDLGSGNTIFVGSSCDMWAEDISVWLISSIINHCKKYDNQYLFQSKYPERFKSIGQFPSRTILGTTIESNRCCCVFTPGAPCTSGRYLSMRDITLPKTVSIEPLMDFDINELVRWMQEIKPQFVSIGADSQGHKLPEPNPEKVKALIEALKEFTEVKVKKNLNRILGEI